MRLNFRNLKIICFTQPRNRSKMIGVILKNVQKTSVFILMTLYVMR